jgi:hypothetical protein
MASLLVDLARAERSGVDPELPSIAQARAMLRVRMADLSDRRLTWLSAFRILACSLAARSPVAALAVVIVVASALVLRYSTLRADLPLLSSHHGVLPNHVLTPGAARPAALAEVCSVSHEQVVKAVSPTLRQRVFAEYGIPLAQSDRYEVDYLITPGLGGDDDLRNLWPEPYNADVWNAHRKDALEERLHGLVCSHQVDLSLAQKEISMNWIAAYDKYVQHAPEKASGIVAPSLSRS